MKEIKMIKISSISVTRKTTTITLFVIILANISFVNCGGKDGSTIIILGKYNINN